MNTIVFRKSYFTCDGDCDANVEDEQALNLIPRKSAICEARWPIESEAFGGMPKRHATDQGVYYLDWRYLKR